MSSLDMLELRDEAKIARMRTDYEHIRHRAIEKLKVDISAQEDRIAQGQLDLDKREAELETATEARTALRQKLVAQNLMTGPPLGHPLLAEWQEVERNYDNALGMRSQLQRVFLPIWLGELNRMQKTLADFEGMPESGQAATIDQLTVVCGRV